MSSNPVRFAVVGCGQLAQSQHLPNIVRSPRMVLHACCDISDENLEACRKFDPVSTSRDYLEVMKDPGVDAVCVATTETLRLPVIRAAVDAGRPIFVEKPMAASLEEAVAIRDLVVGAGIPFCVGHNRRCAPAMAEAHRIFRAHMTSPQPCPWRWDREGANRPERAEDGVASMNVSINDDWYSWKGYAFNRDTHGHGPMVWEMTHFVDLCNWLLASKPERVVAQESSHLNAGVVVRYATGEIATISMCANGSFGYPKESYVAMGHGGVVANHHMVEVTTAGIEDAPPTVAFPLLNDPYDGQVQEDGLRGWFAKRALACRDAEAHGDGARVMVSEPDKGHERMLEAFVDEIRGERGPVCGVEDALSATRVCLAALKSAREERFVQVDEVG